MYAENYQNRERFDKDIAKIVQFLPHMVYYLVTINKMLHMTWKRSTSVNEYLTID